MSLFRPWLACIIIFFVLVLTQYTFGEMIHITLYSLAVQYTTGLSNLQGIPQIIVLMFDLFMDFLLMFIIVYPVIYVLKRQDDRWRVQ